MDPGAPPAVAYPLSLRDVLRVLERRLAVIGVVLAIAAAPGAARADESAASASLGWATYSLPGEDDMDITSYWGGQLNVMYERAFSEPLSWRVELGGAIFHHDEGASYLVLADAGLVYRFDVLTWVPYVFGGVGGVWATGGPLPSTTEPVLMLGGGIDKLFDRDRSAGIEVHLASFAGTVTTFSLAVRGTFRWGYF
jgi:hypothetical protein